MTEQKTLTLLAPVVSDEQIYVPRDAQEAALRRALSREGFAALTGPSRTGKTSVVQRLARGRSASRPNGVDRIALIGLDGIPYESVEGWLKSFEHEVRVAFELDPPPFGAEKPDTPTQAVVSLLEEVIAAHGSVLLILDEINELAPTDSRSGEQNTAATAVSAALERGLREVAGPAGENAANQLRVLLVGTLEPSAVFPVGSWLTDIPVTRVEDFTRDELDAFEGWIKRLSPHAGRWLDAFFKLVRGQPLLTQKLCAALDLGVLGDPAQADDSEGEAWIGDRVDVYARALGGEGQKRDGAFDVLEKHVRDLPSSEALDVLALYGSCLEHGRVDIEHALEQQAVRSALNSGLVRVHHGERGHDIVEPRNPLFAQTFDRAWVEGRVARLQRPFAKEVHQWNSSGRELRGLPGGAELEQTIAALMVPKALLSQLEKDYLAACLDKARQIQTKRFFVFGVVALLTIAALVTALIFYRKATQEAVSAQNDAESALNGFLNDDRDVSSHIAAAERIQRDFGVPPSETALNSPANFVRVYYSHSSLLKDLQSSRAEVASLQVDKERLVRLISSSGTQAQRDLTACNSERDAAATRLEGVEQNLEISRRALRDCRAEYGTVTGALQRCQLARSIAESSLESERVSNAQCQALVRRSQCDTLAAHETVPTLRERAEQAEGQQATCVQLHEECTTQRDLCTTQRDLCTTQRDLCTTERDALREEVRAGTEPPEPNPASPKM